MHCWNGAVAAGMATCAMLVGPISPPLPPSQPRDAGLIGRYDDYSWNYDLVDGESVATKAFGVLDLRLEASKYVRGDVLEGGPLFLNTFHCVIKGEEWFKDGGKEENYMHI